MNKQRWEKWQLPVIALLLASALVLFTQTPLFSWPEGNFSLTELFRSDERIQSESSAPAMPLQITVTNPYGRYFYDRLTTEDNVYLRYLPLLKDAVSSAGAASTITAEQFQQACQAPGVAVDLLADYGASLLQPLFQLESSNLTPSLRHLVIVEAADDQTLLLYTADEKGNYRRYTTAAAAATLEQAADGEGTSSTFFAFELTDALYPFSMYAETPDSYPILSAENPMTEDSAEDVAALLDFSSNSHYTESSGTQVMVDEANYLYLYTDGSVHYQGSESAGELFLFSGSTAADALSAAWRLAERLDSYAGGSGQLYLQSCESSEGGFLLNFGYMVQGVPLQLSRDPFALQVRTENGVITDFIFHARRYTVTESDCLILPVMQAVAAIGEKQHLWLGYADTGSESVSVLWLAR